MLGLGALRLGRLKGVRVWVFGFGFYRFSGVVMNFAVAPEG